MTDKIVIEVHSDRDEKTLANRLLLGARSAANAHGLDINAVLKHMREAISK